MVEKQLDGLCVLTSIVIDVFNVTGPSKRECYMALEQLVCPEY